MDLFDIAIGCIKKINTLGYSAYIVGGAVRDKFLKREINDIDIASNITIKALEENFEIVKKSYAKNFLSRTILYEGFEIEITLFRRDISYSNHRHPLVSKVDTIEKDLKRRDFTINALAYDGNRLIDLYKGLSHLNLKIIKAIRNPNKRFNEDSLRILRAIYFSCKLDFRIEAKTLRGMERNAKYLATLSHEALIREFIKIINLHSNISSYYLKRIKVFKYIPGYKELFYKLNYSKLFVTYDEFLILLLYYNKNININISKKLRLIVSRLDTSLRDNDIEELIEIVRRNL